MRSVIYLQKRGLTLIELLITVAVVILLMATLMPALTSARESGRRTKCLGNLRQLATAMNLYTTDNAGRLPPYFYQLVAEGGGQYSLTNMTSWSLSYVGPGASTGVLTCPSDKTPASIASVSCSYSYNFLPFMLNKRITGLTPSSIALLWDGNPNAMSSELWWGTPDCTPDDNNKVYVCHNGSNTIYININALPAHLNHGGDYCGPCGLNPSSSNLALMNQQAVSRRHFKKINTVFLDGHIRWVADLPDNSLN